MAYSRKSDQAVAARKHYDQNRALIKHRVKLYNAESAERVRAYIAGYLSGHHCVDCGEGDPIVLEFDHRVRAEKTFNIADAVRTGRSLQTVIAEVKKCDVRCANCHRRKTFRENQELKPPRKPDEPPRLPLFDLQE